MREFIAKLFRRQPNAGREAERKAELLHAQAGHAQVQESQRQVDEHFHQLVAGVRDYAIFLLDAKGRVLTWNTGAERIKGYSAAEIIGQPFSRFYPKEAVASGWPERELEVAATSGRFEDEGWRIRKDGSRFWANVVITALRSEAGTVRGYLKIARDLSDRKQLEEKLRFSEERFRLLVERVQEYAIFMLDPEGRVITWNLGAERIKGYQAEEILGQHFSRFYIPEEAETKKPAQALELAAAAGKYEAEDWRVRKDGSRFWASVVITALRDEQGTLRGFSKITRDITERKQAEENARRLLQEEAARQAAEASLLEVEKAHREERRLREQLHVTLSSIGDAVIVTDANGLVTFLNPVAESLTGWKKAEAAGQPLHAVFAIINEQTRQPVDNPVAKVYQLGIVIGLANHTVLIARDGREIPIADSGAPIRGEDGAVFGAVLVFRDVTEERRSARAIEESEAQLRESEGRLRLFIDHAPAAIAMFDQDMHYLAASRRWLSDYQLEDRPIIGKSHYQVFPEIPERWKAAHRRGLAGEVQRSEEDRFDRADGKMTWLRWEIRPWYKEYSQVGGIVIFTEDITEQKRLQDQLRGRAGELIEAGRRKDEFLALLAHELRNPLGPIRNGVHLLKQPNAPAVSLEKVRDIMERQVSHLTRLVDDLLDVSRFTRGKIVLRKQIIDLASVVRAAVETTRPLIEENRHELALVVPGEPINVVADPTRFEQILTNLLNNAARFTDPGGKIWLSVEKEPEQVVVRVRDNGIGISAEMLPRVFDMFEQAERRLDRMRGGLGIGLTLARRLAELHGGTVQALSAGLGQGSEFVLRMPIGEPPSVFPIGVGKYRGGPMGRRTEDRGPPAPRHRRVLVVDDNVDAGMSLAMVLRMANHDVRVANDGPTALRAAESDPPEVVFVDIAMPGMDGYEVARQLRKRPGLEKALLVALTGYGQIQDRRRSQEAGFDEHLVKPVDPAVLLGLLK